jgi:hypothetical protein
MRVLLVVAALVLAGCGAEKPVDDGLVIPDTAVCEAQTPAYITCTWLDPATQCYFQAHQDPVTRKAFMFDAWC